MEKLQQQKQDLEDELDKNIGYKNQAIMRSKLDKAIVIAPKLAPVKQIISSQNQVNNRGGDGVCLKGKVSNPSGVNVCLQKQQEKQQNVQTDITLRDGQAQNKTVKLVNSKKDKPEKEEKLQKVNQSEKKELVVNSSEKQNIAPIQVNKQKQQIQKVTEKTQTKSQESKRATNLQATQSHQERASTARYDRGIIVQDDLCLIPEYDQDDKIVTTFKENRLLKNLRIKFNSKIVIQTYVYLLLFSDPNEDELNPQLDYETAKQMYMSFDGGKLTSTLINLDIEEMCFCYACAILKHIEHGESNNRSIINKGKKLREILEEDKDYVIPKQKSIYQNKEEQQTNIQPSFQPLNSYNNSLNLQINPVQEPIQTQEDQSQSNVDASRYLKQGYSEQRDKLEKDLYWRQKKSLSDISEHTQEISHMNMRSIMVEQQSDRFNNVQNNKNISSKSRKQFDSSRQEMEEILKESLLFKLNDNQSLQIDDPQEKDFEYTQDEADYQEQYNYDNQQQHEEEQQEKEEVELIDDEGNNEQINNPNEEIDHIQFNKENEFMSEGEIEQEDEKVVEKQQQEESSLNFSMISRYSMVIVNDDNSNRRLFDKTYNNRENSDTIFAQKPTKENIQNYCKNVCISCQLEKQIPIIALVYIERLLEKSGFTVTSKNWRKITITAMIMASKIWDDESFENQNFAQAFTQFDVIEINEMERVFLNFIDYNLYVKGADYAKYYFILREFAQKNKKSFPLRPLDLKTILHLQNNANRAQTNLRELYQNSLNKSF